MSDQQTSDATNRTLRDKVLRCITDNPGMVVYRDQIVEQTKITGDRITGVMSRMLHDGNPITADIDVVVPGRAWRYLPSARVRRAVQAVTGSRAIPGEPTKSVPMTQSIRRYFKQNPNRVIYVDELQDMMSTDGNPVEETKIRVGVANARANNTEFKNAVSTVVAGRAWIYTPPERKQDDVADASTTTTTTATRTTGSAPSAPSPAQSSPSPSPSSPRNTGTSDASEDKLLIFEDLGNMSDGSRLVRDEDQQLYRLYKM